MTIIKILKMIFILLMSILLVLGFIYWYYFSERKIVERDKVSTVYQIIENPFQDGQDFHQIIKYLYSEQKWIIGWGGGGNSWEAHYGYGLADADKNTIITAKQRRIFQFYKGYGYTKNETIDSINIIHTSQHQLNGENVIYTIYHDTGILIKNNHHFKNNLIILGRVEYPEKGCLLDIEKNECIISHQSMWWIDSETILVGKKIKKEGSKEKIALYGAMSTTGEMLIPTNKHSKKEVLTILDKNNK